MFAVGRRTLPARERVEDLYADAPSLGDAVQISEQRRIELRSFLRRCRNRIPYEAHSLGRHVRPPVRWGRRVTQEEVAEAIGVSRVWYSLLESGQRISVSTRLLDRLAGVLSLSVESRLALFCLAVPELDGILGLAG
jgi:DNA-binding XRE family transcriptional regulator